MSQQNVSAGFVLVRRHEGQWRYLLLRAYNYWDFPKGLVEAGETPFEAARREVTEETGIEELSFPWGEVFIETEPYSRGKVARYYLAQTSQVTVRMSVNPQLHRPEHHESRWLSYSEARALLVPRVAKVLDWAHGIVEPA